MKTFYLLTILFYFNLMYSQRICEYGEYNFPLNHINGIQKNNFCKIIFKDSSIKDKVISYYKFNSNNKISVVKSKENTFDDETKPCYYKRTIQYKYSNKEKQIGKNIFLTYENKLIKNIKHKELNIELNYDNFNRIKTILKNGIKLKYLWNNNNKISEINVIDKYDKTLINKITFIYNKEKIYKIKHIKKSRDYFLINNEYSYQYKKNKISEIRKIKNFKTVIFYKYIYSNKDKLIINRLNSKREYLNHYECYHKKITEDKSN